VGLGSVGSGVVIGSEGLGVDTSGESSPPPPQPTSKLAITNVIIYFLKIIPISP